MARTTRQTADTQERLCALNVRIPAHVHAAGKEAAKRAGKTWDTVVAEAIEAWARTAARGTR